MYLMVDRAYTTHTLLIKIICGKNVENYRDSPRECNILNNNTCALVGFPEILLSYFDVFLIHSEYAP